MGDMTLNNHAVYAGSFDPVTLGHKDIIRRAATMFGHVTVVVAHHPTKKGLFSIEERIELIKDAVADLPRVDVQSTEGLIVDFCHKIGAQCLVRGLRSESDFAYEMQMAAVNREIAPDIETVFLLASRDTMFLSSSVVRELASLGHCVDDLVTPMVADALMKRYAHE